MESIVIAFGIVTGLLGIPSSLYALRTLKHDLFGKPEDAEAVAEQIRAVLSPGRPHDQRVLLHFDPTRANEPGTLEHAIHGFVEACSLEEDKNFIIRNPVGVYRANGILSFQLFFIGAAAVFLLIFFWTMIVFALAYDAFRAEWVPWVVMTAASPLLAAGAYLAIRRGLQFKRGRDAARAYLDYLSAREISIGIEFTQSRRSHELERASKDELSRLQNRAANPISSGPLASV